MLAMALCGSTTCHTRFCNNPQNVLVDMDEKKKQLLRDLSIINNLDASISYSSQDSIKRVLDAIHINRYFSTAYGERFKKKLEALLSGEKGDFICVVCGKPSNNGRLLCSACAEAINKGKNRVDVFSAGEGKITMPQQSYLNYGPADTFNYIGFQYQNLSQDLKKKVKGEHAKSRKVCLLVLITIVNVAVLLTTLYFQFFRKKPFYKPSVSTALDSNELYRYNIPLPQNSLEEDLIDYVHTELYPGLSDFSFSYSIVVNNDTIIFSLGGGGDVSSSDERTVIQMAQDGNREALSAWNDLVDLYTGFATESIALIRRKVSNDAHLLVQRRLMLDSSVVLFEIYDGVVRYDVVRDKGSLY